MIYLYNENGKKGADSFSEIHDYLTNQGAILEDDGYANEYSFEDSTQYNDIKEPLEEMFPDADLEVNIDDMYPHAETDLNIYVGGKKGDTQ